MESLDLILKVLQCHGIVNYIFTYQRVSSRAILLQNYLILSDSIKINLQIPTMLWFTKNNVRKEKKMTPQYIFIYGY